MTREEIMQFEFEPNLKHQFDAISAVVGIFERVSYIHPEEYMFTGNDKSTLLCLDDTLHEKTVDSLIDKYSTHHLIFSKHAVDTAKKWLLHNAFTDNMQVV